MCSLLLRSNCFYALLVGRDRKKTYVHTQTINVYIYIYINIYINVHIKHSHTPTSILYLSIHLYLLETASSYWSLQFQSSTTGFLLSFTLFTCVNSLLWQWETWLSLSTIHLFNPRIYVKIVFELLLILLWKRNLLTRVQYLQFILSLACEHLVQRLCFKLLGQISGW